MKRTMRQERKEKERCEAAAVQPNISREDEIPEEKASSSSLDDDTKELDKKMAKQAALLREQRQHRPAKVVSPFTRSSIGS